MPTYEYACNSCGQHLDAVQSFSDDPLTVCPNCGGELRKVFGAVGIVLKGSGFYKTDSRSSGKAARNGSSSDGSKAADGASTSDTKSSASKDSSPSPSGSGDGGSNSNGSSKADSPSKAATAS